MGVPFFVLAQNIADSKLGQTVGKLCKYEQDGDVQAVATEVKKIWSARAAAAAPARRKASCSGCS